MADDSRLSDLLRRWRHLRSQGKTLSPAEICADCPELLDDLHKQIQAQLLMENVVANPAAPPQVPGGTASPQLGDRARAEEASGERTLRAGRTSGPAGSATIGEGAGGGSSAPGTGRRVIAGYEILEELGRGGMGVVYKARQLGLNRLVALKMILAGGHASSEVVERFRREAEAVARLQHPNIIQIHEIGEHDGLPFFSLEYVSGGSLDRKLMGMPQPPERAASWIATLARAVHAAHGAGIVHRDLKPHNVLLTPEGTLKVTDFGLAKQLEGATWPQHAGATPRLSDPAQATESGVVMGTPSYMAPEQAAGKIKQIGPATDVYALGAMLYEMLTGRPPFRAASPIDTVMQILSEEAVPPRRLQPKVPVDLDTICLKCLAKEPSRRYADAGALAEDVQRFLNREPILARPTPWYERAWKWVRRRPAAAASLAVSAVAVVTLLTLGGLWLDVDRRAAEAKAKAAEDISRLEKERAEKEETLRKTADEQRELAEKHFAQAMAAVDRMLTRVSEDKDLLAYEPHMEQVRRKLLEDALEFYQKLLEEKKGDPRVRFETAKAFLRVGEIRHALGRYVEAEDAMNQAVGLLLPLVEQFPGDAAYQEELGRSYEDLAFTLRELGRLEQAEKALHAALKWQQPLADTFADRPAYRQALARTFNSLGNLLHDIVNSLERPEEARKAHQQALALRQKLAQDFPDNAEYQRDLSQSLHNMAVDLEGRDDGKAEQLYRQAATIRKKLVKDHPRVPLYRQYLARTLHNLAITLRLLKEDAEAESVFAEVLELREKLAAEFPGFAQFREELLTTYRQRSNLYTQTGRPELGQKDLQRAVDLGKKLVAELGHVPAVTRLVAETYNQRGLAWFHQKNYAAAAADYEEAIRFDPTYGMAHGNYGWLWHSQGQTDKALAHYNDALHKDPKLAFVHNNRGYLFLQKKELDKAIADFDLAVKLRPAFILAYENRAQAHYAKGNEDAALADVLKVMELDPKRISSLSQAVAQSLSDRGFKLMQQGELDKALADLSQALKLHPKLALAYENRALVFHMKGNHDAAIADLTRLIELEPKKANAYFGRGYLYWKKGAMDKAFADMEKAIALDPEHGHAFNGRAYLWAGKKMYARAIVDFEKAIALNPKDADARGNLAWLLATCPVAKFRDGKYALKLAEEACRLTAWQNPSVLEILAAAHAEVGDFAKAIELQKKALAAPDYPKQDLPAGPERLKLYEQGQPVRQDKLKVPGEARLGRRLHQDLAFAAPPFRCRWCAANARIRAASGWSHLCASTVGHPPERLMA